jgi:hypothetical protein
MACRDLAKCLLIWRCGATNESSAAPVIAVVATTVALSAPVTTAVAPARAYAQGQRGAVRKALGTSKLIPRRRTQAWRSHATFGPRWQRFAPRFHAALRDSELSAAPALSRWLVPGALSTMRPPREQFSRPVVSSSQRSSSRSSAWPAVTSQVRGRVSQLPAWLHRRKIAKPRYRRHQHKLRSGSGLDGIVKPICVYVRMGPAKIWDPQTVRKMGPFFWQMGPVSHGSNSMVFPPHIKASRSWGHYFRVLLRRG